MAIKYWERLGGELMTAFGTIGAAWYAAKSSISIHRSRKLASRLVAAELSYGLLAVRNDLDWIARKLTIGYVSPQRIRPVTEKFNRIHDLPESDALNSLSFGNKMAAEYIAEAKGHMRSARRYVRNTESSIQGGQAISYVDVRKLKEYCAKANIKIKNATTECKNQLNQ